MSKRKQLTIYTALGLLYLYIWLDGGRIGQILALLGIGSTLLFLVLYYVFGKTAAKSEKVQQQTK
jgi:hypothetical protein